jgi:hypothetical protein
MTGADGAGRDEAYGVGVGADGADGANGAGEDGAAAADRTAGLKVSL